MVIRYSAGLQKQIDESHNKLALEKSNSTTLRAPKNTRAKAPQQNCKCGCQRQYDKLC